MCQIYQWAKTSFIIVILPKTAISSIWNLRSPRIDRDTKLIIYRCDICDDVIPEAPDNFEGRIKILDEIDNSFESELDRSTYEQGPKLILCYSCSKEYLIPSWIK
jgi:hypothetical protein